MHINLDKERSRMVEEQIVYRQVQAEARAAPAEIVSSEAFALLIRETRASAPKANEDRKLSKDEVEEWLNLFQRGTPK